jgi:hypothetical protein
MIIVHNDVGKTLCMSVIKSYDFQEFIKSSSEVLCGFVTLALGEKHVFPQKILENRLKFLLRDYIEFDKYYYFVRCEEATCFNVFNIRVSVIDPSNLGSDEMIYFYEKEIKKIIIDYEYLEHNNNFFIDSAKIIFSSIGVMEETDNGS